MKRNLDGTAFFPSPLVGEGGSPRSGETGEGFSPRTIPCIGI